MGILLAHFGTSSMSSLLIPISQDLAMTCTLNKYAHYGKQGIEMCFHFAMFVYVPMSSWSQTNVGMLMTFTLLYPPPPPHTHLIGAFFNAIYLISPFLRYSPDQHPVLAFKGAPARFPVLPKHRHLQQYLKWSKMKNAEADEYINNTIGDVPYLAIHLRMGIDWVGCSSSHSYTLLNVHCTPSVKQTKLERSGIFF